jgi:hypothetical protein
MNVRKRSARKRAYKKRPKSTANFASRIKAVLYKHIETKSRISNSQEELALSQNTPRIIYSNLLVTDQGTDGDGRTGNRIGVSVNPIGLSMYIQAKQYQPLSSENFLNGDIIVKVWIFKTHHSNVNTSNDFLHYINSNSLMAPVERRTHNTVKILNFCLRNLYTGPTTNGQVIDVAPAFKTMKIWIPFKGKYLYENDTSNVGKKYNYYIVHACAYSAHPAAITGTVLAQINMAYEFFFKDAQVPATPQRERGYVFFIFLSERKRTHSDPSCERSEQ